MQQSQLNAHIQNYAVCCSVVASIHTMNTLNNC